jgi:hypothetical protein
MTWSHLKTKSKARFAAFLCSSTMMVLIGGCNDKQVVFKQIDSFSATVQASADYTFLYYKALNEQNKRAYTVTLALNPACRVGRRIDYQCGSFGQESEGDEKSPLAEPVISSNSLKARIALLKTLADYAKALGDLASDQSPEAFSKNVDLVRTNFIDLQATFRNVSRDSSSTRLNQDKDLDTRYLQPISSIIQILGSEILEQRKWNAIRKAILAGEPSIRILLDSLRTDLSIASYLPTTLESKIQSHLINYYNSNKNNMTLEKRRELLAEISAINGNIGILKSNDPGQVIDGLSKVHDELVALAKNDATPVTIGRLKAMLDAYSSKIADFRSAVLILSGYKGALQ